MSTLYEKAVELIVEEIQDSVLKEKIKRIIIESPNTIPFYRRKEFGGSINASVPLTRRERRALKRKENKHGNTK